LLKKKIQSDSRWYVVDVVFSQVDHAII